MKHLYLLSAVCLLASSAMAATPVTDFKLDKSTLVGAKVEKIDGLKSKTIAAEKQQVTKAASRADDESTWTSKGMVNFTDDAVIPLFGYDPVSFDVEIEENDATPGLYRLVNPYQSHPYFDPSAFLDGGPYYIVIHAENPDAVYIEDRSIGVNLGYGEITLKSNVESLLTKYSLAAIAEAGYCGTMVNGVISFPVKQLYVGMGGTNYYANQNGEFKIKFPGAKDYSISLSAPSCAEGNIIPLTVNLGSDVTKTLYTIIPGEWGFSEEYYQLVSHKGYDFVTESCTYQIDLGEFEDAGRYTIYVVAVDEDGNYLAGNGTFCYAVYDDNENWKSLGETTYGEDLVGSIYKIGPTEYKVEIQENINTPGFYRLVNPYADDSKWPGASNAGAHDGMNHYIYIHAEDPTRVYIEDSPIGINWSYGDMIVSSLAQYFLNSEEYTADELAEYGVFGTLDAETRTITFPKERLLFAETEDSHGEWYSANLNGKFSLVIPAAGTTSIESISADNTDTVYYNLQGVRVANPTNGIFLKKNGSKVVKVIR